MEQDVEDQAMDSDESRDMSGSESEDDLVSKIRKERGLEVRSKST